MSSEYFCPYCGGKIEAEGAVFCPHCGASLEEVSAEAVPPKPVEYREVPRKAGEIVPGVELASVGRRFVALLIDWILLFVLLIFFWSLAIEDGDIDLTLLTIWGIIGLFYWLFLEGVNDGQTLGKMIVDIRVVKFDKATGEISRCTVGASVVRNLLRFIDAIPNPIYLIGLISIASSDYKQRLGDRVADTIVIMATERIPVKT